MTKFLLLYGPNLNRLGARDPKLYGTLSLQQIEDAVRVSFANFDIDVCTYQSNAEGVLIDIIQEAAASYQGIINPASFIFETNE